MTVSEKCLNNNRVVYIVHDHAHERDVLETRRHGQKTEVL